MNDDISQPRLAAFVIHRWQEQWRWCACASHSLLHYNVHDHIIVIWRGLTSSSCKAVMLFLWLQADAEAKATKQISVSVESLLLHLITCKRKTGQNWLSHLLHNIVSQDISLVTHQHLCCCYLQSLADVILVQSNNRDSLSVSYCEESSCRKAEACRL